MSHGSADDLTLLGSNTTTYKFDGPEDVPLETIPWKARSRGTTVELHCPEFTALCPRTSQPDFAKLVIRYEPRDKLVESKALKLYLFAFRNHGDFHETSIDRIAHDLFDVMSPYWVEVRGEFLPRGGISIWPTCRLEADDA